MARQLRIEFSGALYYLCTLGNGGNNIFRDSDDGRLWLELFENVCRRFNWSCLSYCLMSDRYHLVIRTKDANLSKGMRQLNGVYTQNFNRKHNTGGHLFQGRYKSILVQEDKYLLPLIKHIFLLPLKAGFVKHPNQFKWSSCNYLYNKNNLPPYLENSWFKESFSNELKDFESYLTDGSNEDIFETVKKQIYLGDDHFISSIQIKNNVSDNKKEIPKVQITAPVSKVLSAFRSEGYSEKDSIAKTYITGKYTLKQIGDFLGIHYSKVSKIVKEYESSI